MLFISVIALLDVFITLDTYMSEQGIYCCQPGNVPYSCSYNPVNFCYIYIN